LPAVEPFGRVVRADADTTKVYQVIKLQDCKIARL
jgi:hypothetical protein